jgi:hypothetical protein
MGKEDSKERAGTGSTSAESTGAESTGTAGKSARSTRAGSTGAGKNVKKQSTMKKTEKDAGVKIDDMDFSERARKIAKNKISFIRHLITYVAVILVLALINNVTHPGRQWWLWVALFWGIGVFFNFLNAFIFKGGGLKKLEEEMTQKEFERLKKEGE